MTLIFESVDLVPLINVMKEDVADRHLEVYKGPQSSGGAKLCKLLSLWDMHIPQVCADPFRGPPKRERAGSWLMLT